MGEKALIEGYFEMLRDLQFGLQAIQQLLQVNKEAGPV